MSFADDLADIGFELIQQTRGGTLRFAHRPHPFLQMWVMAHPDGTAEVTWEVELGAYLKAKGFAISVQDELSLLLFPSSESRGPADAGWVAQEVARAQARLGELDLAQGS